MNFWPPFDGVSRVLKTCNDVSHLAAHSGHRSKHQTNDRFQSAIDTLSSYVPTFHPGSIGSVMVTTNVSLTLK